MEFYRHSGKMPLVGIPLTILFGTLVAFVLGIAYSFAIVYDPIVYINMALACVLGLGIGKAVSFGIRLGKIRNPWVAGAYGMAFGLAGVYFAWVADLWARSDLQAGWLAFQPEVLWAYMQCFYEHGFWAMGHGGGGKEPVTGVFLAIVWVAEASTVVGFATWLAYREISWTPFCELCNCWTKVTENVCQLVVPDEARQRLLAGDLTSLEESRRAAGRGPSYLQMDIARCPKCESTNLLSVHSVQNKIDKKGKVKTSTKVLLKHLVVTDADVLCVSTAGSGLIAEGTDADPQE